MRKLELDLVGHQEVLEEHAEVLHVLDNFDEVELFVDALVTFFIETLELLALRPADAREQAAHLVGHVKAYVVRLAQQDVTMHGNVGLSFVGKVFRMVVRVQVLVLQLDLFGIVLIGEEVLLGRAGEEEPLHSIHDEAVLRDGIENGAKQDEQHLGDTTEISEQIEQVVDSTRLQHTLLHLVQLVAVENILVFIVDLGQRSQELLADVVVSCLTSVIELQVVILELQVGLSQVHVVAHDHVVWLVVEHLGVVDVVNLEGRLVVLVQEVHLEESDPRVNLDIFDVTVDLRLGFARSTELRHLGRVALVDVEDNGLGLHGRWVSEYLELALILDVGTQQQKARPIIENLFAQVAVVFAEVFNVAWSRFDALTRETAGVGRLVPVGVLLHEVVVDVLLEVHFLSHGACLFVLLAQNPEQGHVEVQVVDAADLRDLVEHERGRDSISLLED